jgi:hypothetical protein
MVAFLPPVLGGNCHDDVGKRLEGANLWVAGVMIADFGTGGY